MSTAFRLILEGTQEVPPNGSTASGLGTFIFDSAAVAASYSVRIEGVDYGPATGGLPQTPTTLDDVTSTHFHNQVRGVNGPVVFGQINPAQDNDDLAILLNADGSWTVSGRWETTDPANVSLANFAAVLGSAAVGTEVPLYFNVHTMQFPGGEIRGQLVAIADDNDNVVEGTAGDDLLPGLGGNDIILGFAGDDTLEGGDGNDVMLGGEGNDMLAGGTGGDVMQGGSGNDIYVVGSAADIVSEEANAGFDTVRSSVSYTLSANVERLLLSGGPAIDGTGNALNNVITGNDAANVLSGLAGNDMLRGRDGDDALNGGLGADTMQGDDGNDVYTVDNAGDVVIEGAGGGFDTVRSSISYTLGANVERLLLSGGPANNGTGNDLDNVITGNNAANVLSGLDGNDMLSGRGGDDILIGGLGSDNMQGGADNDSFVFNTALGDSNVDTIADFDPALDIMQLDDAVFTDLPLGALAASAFNSGGAVDADDRIIYNSVSGELSFDPDGSGATAATQFATLSNLAVISNTDFIVV
jgi:Ca2+-binding RTX toxin-like protein